SGSGSPAAAHATRRAARPAICTFASWCRCPPTAPPTGCRMRSRHSKARIPRTRGPTLPSSAPAGPLKPRDGGPQRERSIRGGAEREGGSRGGPEALPADGPPEERPAAAAPREGAALVPTDLLQRYLAEIRRIPVLSREEEHELAVRWHEQGDRRAAWRLVTS